MKDFKEENLREVLDYQFKSAGYPDMNFDKAKVMSDKTTQIEADIEKVEGEEREALMEQRDKSLWYRNYTATEKQGDEFKERLTKYLIPYTGKARASKEASMFILNYGLRTKNVETN